jgi:hypothetical protein
MAIIVIIPTIVTVSVRTNSRSQENKHGGILNHPLAIPKQKRLKDPPGILVSKHHQAWGRHPTEKFFKGKTTSNSHIIQPIMN